MSARASCEEIFLDLIHFSFCRSSWGGSFLSLYTSSAVRNGPRGVSGWYENLLSDTDCTFRPPEHGSTGALSGKQPQALALLFLNLARDTRKGSPALSWVAARRGARSKTLQRSDLSCV